MTTLHLGMLDIPYGKKGSATTGDVAEIIEHKYGLMETFVAMHARVIEHEIENSVRGAIETMIMGGPKTKPLAAAMPQIEHLYRDALTMQSYDHKIPGVPTQAALRGVSHRFKHPYAKRNPRPSFIDTGLMQRSMRAWTD